MPNWVENEIEIEGTPEALAVFLAAVCMPEGSEAEPGGSVFAFDRIIPMPAVLRRTHSGSMVIDGQQVCCWFEDEDGRARLPTAAEAAEIEAVGYASWYEWARANWGCKWSASQVEIDYAMLAKGLVTISFNTPWSAPEPVFAKLRESFPNLRFTFRWCDEDERWPHSM